MPYYSPIIPLLFPVINGDSPVATTFPRSNYRGFFYYKGILLFNVHIVHWIKYIATIALEKQKHVGLHPSMCFHFASADVYSSPPLSLDLEFILAPENPWITQS